MTKRQTLRSLAEAIHKHAADEERIWTDVQGKVHEVHVALMGTIGPPEQPGLIARVRDLEGIASTVRRLTWIAVTCLVGTVLAAGCAVYESLAH